MENGSSNATDQLSGKYLSFHLSDEEYGLPLASIHEIIRLQEITVVPRAPDFLKGVINLRGRIIPVVDLRLKFSLPEAEYTEKTSVIITSSGEMTAGVIVDAVSEVVDIPEDAIGPPPAIGSHEAPEFILGMGKIEDRVLILLSADRIFSEQERQIVESAAT